MNILVTGANGQLGNEIRLLSKRSAHRFVFTDVVEQEGADTVMLDITDADQISQLVRQEQIDVVVNCAAYTNVEAAETNPALAELLNAAAPENLAQAMQRVGGLLIHISTDYVFGKEPYNTPCREDQQGTPTGVYGLTKRQGEERIAASGCCHVIIRTAWLYSEYGRNFVKTMLQLTAAKPQLKVVFDQVGTPTYALDLAAAILAVVDDYAQSATWEKTGIYHYSNEGVCSWFDFARTIAELSGHTECEVLPCHSDEFPSCVTRPSFSVLDKTKIKQTFSLAVPYWTDSLRQCLANMGQLA